LFAIYYNLNSTTSNTTLFFKQEAEQHNFTAEDLQVAMNHCGDKNPIDWLRENWRNMIDTVVTLATNYGHERKENNIGTISVSEARDALRLHKGNVWAAVTECVEQRQKKVYLPNF
jgi:E3 ubiquitin-protein ligase RNF31